MTDPVLTAESVRGMGAGRELDALVAERVMGWHLYPGEAYTANGKPWIGPDDMGVGCSHPAGWLPSTRIEDAWRVVEKFTGTECDGRVAILAITDAEDGWGFQVGASDESDQSSFRAFAPTPQLAICRAALLTTL